MKKLNVSSISINTTPLDWTGNCQKIQSSLLQASFSGAQLVVFPELAVSGYGCEDAFFTEDLAERAMKALYSIPVPEGVVAVVGLPVMINNRLYNGAAVISRNGRLNGTSVHGIVLKRYLARNGVHYEPRWFQSWPENEVQTIETPEGVVRVGDLTFDVFGFRVGVEICEDAWVANRPGRNLYARGVDVIVNPSASHFALGKYEIRKQFAKEASRSLGCGYVYANLNGCESGRAVFDGGNFVVSGGEVVGAGDVLHFRDYAITNGVIDRQENRIAQQWNSDRVLADAPDEIRIMGKANKKDVPFPISRKDQRADEEALIVRTIALGLRDWMKKTGTNGFVVSLSGGADSALVSACVNAMTVLATSEADRFGLPLKYMLGLGDRLPKEAETEHPYDLTYRILRTVYQGSLNSSDTTLEAARTVADGLGAQYSEWRIDDLVQQVTDKVSKVLEREMTWETDDIALQNIQARVRAPGVWMLANTENKLLLATGNLSEMAMGYMTMDGDTCGVLAPISGLSKTRVRNVLRYLEKTGVACPYLEEKPLLMPFLKCINDQTPTAELRPGEQDDESDLMPYKVSDFIRSQFLNQRRSPAQIFVEACEKLPEYESKQLAEWIEKFFTLFSKTRWKTDRSAPGFHLESDSLDSRAFSRFPLLNSGWQTELQEVREQIKA